MNKTKRSNADNADAVKRQVNEDEEGEGADKVRKLGPPVAQPGVNSSSFLGINRKNIPAVSSIVGSL